MIPVDQTITGDKGNCFAACIASILELPIGSVPNFAEDMDSEQGMCGAAKTWLESRGVAYFPMCFPNPTAIEQTHFGFSDYCIIGGYGPRKNDRGDFREHAVVGKTLPWGVEIVHDPHPDRDGLLNWGHRWVQFLVLPRQVFGEMG